MHQNEKRAPTGIRRVFRSRLVHNTLWVEAGYAAGQFVRLVSNVILAHLLSPAAFGIMGIVNATLGGLNLFSNLGERASIIQNPRGKDAPFLHTAWVIQIIRGFLVAALATALAWPLASINNEPLLRLIIPVAAIAQILEGFRSTSLHVLARDLRNDKLVPFEFSTQIVTTLVMIAWAWLAPSVWALVAGVLAASLYSLTISHTVLRGIAMRIRWDSTAARDIVRFGKWLLLSTALSFLTAQLDVYIIGALAGVSYLGIFVIAKNISRLFVESLAKLTQRVIFPVYSEMVNNKDQDLRSKAVKVRTLLLLVFLPFPFAVGLWGDLIIEFLYDQRYADAGWMLQVLSVGASATILIVSVQPIMLASGNSFGILQVKTVQAIGKFAAMACGFLLGGLPGLIIGSAFSDFIAYPLVVWIVREYRVCMPIVDGLAFVACIGVSYLTLTGTPFF